MFICTKRIKEPSDTSFTYTVLDTDDMVEEKLKIADIKEAFKQGYSILGLEQTEKGIVVDVKYMATTSEYRYYNNENLNIPVNYINYRVDEGLICLDCNCPTNSKFRVLYFVKDDKIVANTNAIPRKDRKHDMFYVEYNIDKVTEYRGIPLIQISLSYYDKHFYREDRGCEFTSYRLVFGKNMVAETDWINLDDKYFRDWLIPDNQGKFNWCEKTIDLDIWL